MGFFVTLIYVDILLCTNIHDYMHKKRLRKQ